MARGEIHYNDIGTIFEVTVKDQDSNIVDISTATKKQIKFKKPSLVVVEKDAVFSTDGKDGKMRYITIATDLNQLGDWSYEGYLELPSGKWHSDVYTFRVYPNLS